MSVITQCQSQGVEVYRVQSSDELAQTLRKRRKKAAKKQDKEVGVAWWWKEVW